MKFLIKTIIMVLPISAFSYIGPGMAGGAIIKLLGILLGLILSLLSIIFYPIKRAIQNRKNKKR